MRLPNAELAMYGAKLHSYTVLFNVKKKISMSWITSSTNLKLSNIMDHT